MALNPDTRQPQRTCAGCGTNFDQDTLVRVVLSPERTVELDYNRKVPGRGAYFFPHRDCLDRAVKRKAFLRTLRAEGGSVDADRLWETLVRANREQLENGLRLALKAGAVVSGSNNVRAALSGEGVRMILLADDASENTREQFESTAAARGISFARALNQDDIGRILGKAPRAVVAILHPAFERHLMRDKAVYDAIRNRTGCQEKR